MPKILPTVTLVGEANPYGGDPEYALYPSPEGCSGYRLCVLILGMSRVHYLQAFQRVNLCPQDWSIRQARARAVQLVQPGQKLVLLGSKVCQAFQVAYEPLSTTTLILGEVKGSVSGCDALVLPHPSGLCRWWNSPGAFELARAAVADFAPEVF